MNENHSAGNFLPRLIGARLERALATHPVVVLTGARQTGKSTLVEQVISKAGLDHMQLSLDEIDLRADATHDPAAFINRSPKLSIDEVQLVPELLYAIKRAVDTDRPRIPGRFLLTGSANLALMKNVSESLAGRAAYITVWPLTRRELLGLGTAGIWGTLISSPVRDWYDIVKAQTAPAANWMDHARIGGYPTPAYEYSTDEARHEWFLNYISTYLQRDVPNLSDIENLPDFRRLMRAISLRTGNLQNQTELGRDTGLPQPTVHRYLNLLDTSFQLIRLPAYSVNRTKRLVKSPKTYWSDTGLAMVVGGETEPRGAHFENFIISDILAWRDAEAMQSEVMYWRTVSGHEVDVVIETPQGNLLPIEIKATARPTTKSIAPLRTFIEDYKDRVIGGLVIHTGDDTFWISPGVLATPWWTVM